MDLDKGTIFHELAAFVQAEGIPACVLHGIDPITGKLGRDLDLFIPNTRQAYRVALYFADLLKQRGTEWISLMHPIWGPRCIGIRKQDLSYQELHVVTRLRLGTIDFGELFPVQGEVGPYGFRFDPSYWFVKDVLIKQVASFASRRPVWTVVPRRPYVMNCKVEIADAFQARWHHGADLVMAALGEDTEANLRLRQRLLLNLLSANFLQHPVNAVSALARWVYRKGTVYGSSSVPVIGIVTDMDASTLQSCLLEKLGHVFLRIVVTEQLAPWHRRRWLQATQSLPALKSNRIFKDSSGVDNWIQMFATDSASIAAGIASILDDLVQYNQGWRALYQRGSLAGS